MSLKYLKLRHGVIVPMVLVILSLLAIMGFGLHGYISFEKNLVARLQFSSIADKMAQAAANEAAGSFNKRVLNFKNLNESDLFDKFVLAPLNERKVNSLVFRLTPEQLKTYKIISELGGTLNYVELKYEGFQNYFTNAEIPADYSTGSVCSPDPFERFGGVVISSNVTYKTVSRLYCCRYEIKTSNTLLAPVSKFTLFARDRDDAPENNLAMARFISDPYANTDLGAQGIIDAKVKPLRVPLILIHHPDDIACVAGPASMHGDIRFYLPHDLSIHSESSTAKDYRPHIASRGWVYLGALNPTVSYNLNISPGKVNPDPAGPYPAELNHLHYGEAFLLLESDLFAPVFKALRGDYPYPHSFLSAEKPPGVDDFLLRITQSGIFWIVKAAVCKDILGNYYASNPTASDRSSLLQLSGDIQPTAFIGSRPSKYIDRRSPTLVFGRVGRSFVQIGNLAQNACHPQSSSMYSHMLEGGVHKMPYPNSTDHPRTTFLPYFNIDDNGNLTNNQALAFTDANWGGFKTVDDTCFPPVAGDFARVSYGVDAHVFKCHNANAFKTYKFFMTKIKNESYNKSYNWIAANSQPAGGVIEPGGRYGLKQDEIKIVRAFPGRQDDEVFFYGARKGETGNCFNAANIRIMQYSNKNGEIEENKETFSEGIFTGALGSIKLVDDSYSPPDETTGTVSGIYDIRQKADFIFKNYQDFEKHFINVKEGGICELKENGVFYFNMESPLDLSAKGACRRLIFHDNAMIIVKKDVIVPEIIKSSYGAASKSTMTIISVEGNVVIAGKKIEASLNALKGTIKKKIDYFQVFGNMTMGQIKFDLLSSGNLFRVDSLPSGASTTICGTANIKGFERLNVVYDPCLDPCDAVNYKNHYKYHVASKTTYWKLSGGY